MLNQLVLVGYVGFRVGDVHTIAASEPHSQHNLCHPSTLDVLRGSRRVAPNAAASMWLREVGVVLVAAGVTAFLVRGHGDSPMLQAILIGNLVVQVGLFPIELIAYATITRVSGIVSNTALHVVLASGFAYYLATMKGKPSTSRPIAAPSAGQ